MMSREQLGRPTRGPLRQLARFWARSIIFILIGVRRNGRPHDRCQLREVRVASQVVRSGIH